MTEQSAIDTAVKRLALALDALDAAVERRKQADRNEEGLAAQVQALGVDRTRLAAALDGETARSRRLETTNREIAERLDTRDRDNPVGAGRARVTPWRRSDATIAGRQFRLACEDGQEEHLQELAKDIDQRIISLRRKFGEIGDTRLTVMAALMVADEMAETMQKMHRLEEDIAALQDARLVAVRPRQGRVRRGDRCFQFRR